MTNSPPSSAPRVHMQRRARATRESILDSAATHFGTHGYSATSIGELLSDAKSSKGALYFHFPSKAAIADELVTRWAHAVEAIEQKHAAIAGPAIDQLTAISLAHAKLLTSNTQSRAGIRLTAEPGLDHAHALYQQWERRIGALVSAAVDDGQVCDTPTARRFATLYCAAFTGLVHTTARRDGAPDLNTLVLDLLHGWTSGVLAAP